MSLTHHHTAPPRRGLAWRLPDGPLRAFALAALTGAGAVVALSMALFAVAPGIVALSVALYAAAAGVAGAGLARGFPHDRLGLCNLVTLLRLVLVAVLLAALLGGAGLSWTVFAVALLALSLDGVDGWLARRQGLASRFGARFDMEVDSALALVLALSAAVQTEVGLLAVLLGLPRYAFGLAARALPWLRRELPDRFSRKVVCVAQLGVLIALQAPILPPGLGLAAAALASAALLWSFAVDIRWLRRRRG